MIITEELEFPLFLDLENLQSEPLLTPAHHLTASGGISKLTRSYTTNLNRDYGSSDHYSEKHEESHGKRRLITFLL